MMGKTNLQGSPQEDTRELFRRINDYASVTATFTLANTQIDVTHTLGRPPVGWNVIKLNKSTQIYADATILGTATVIRLKSSNSNAVATLRVF